MNKTLSKEIMKKTKLKNNSLKIEQKKIEKNTPRYFFASFLRKTKRNCFNSLNEWNITDNRKFWKLLNQCFRKKVSEKTILVKNRKILSNDNEIAEV